jgi:hypothetical protein
MNKLDKNLRKLIKKLNNLCVLQLMRNGIFLIIVFFLIFKKITIFLILFFRLQNQLFLFEFSKSDPDQEITYFEPIDNSKIMYNNFTFI